MIDLKNSCHYLMLAKYIKMALVGSVVTVVEQTAIYLHLHIKKKIAHSKSKVSV
jgi:hypothetical protein